MKIKKQITLLVALFIYLNGNAQSNFGVKYFGLSIHPNGDKQANLMPYKLDNQGKYVFNFGIIASYQKYILDDFLSVKFAQGIYSDCGGLISGHTHLGFRLSIINNAKHELLFGFGPTFIYRKNWKTAYPDYEDTGIFSSKGNTQQKFVWYGGELEYDFKISKHWDISTHILPGYPLVVSIGVGVRYWPHRSKF